MDCKDPTYQVLRKHNQVTVGHGCLLMDHLHNLWEKNLFLDVSLMKHELVIVQAHKIILEAFSPKFFTLLNRKNELTNTPHIVKIDEFSESNICSLVKFLYTGKLDCDILSSTSKLNSLKEDAKTLHFEHIVEHIEWYQEKLMLSNVSTVTVSSCRNKNNSVSHKGVKTVNYEENENVESDNEKTISVDFDTNVKHEPVVSKTEEDTNVSSKCLNSSDDDTLSEIIKPEDSTNVTLETGKCIEGDETKFTEQQHDVTEAAENLETFPEKKKRGRPKKLKKPVLKFSKCTRHLSKNNKQESLLHVKDIFKKEISVKNSRKNYGKNIQSFDCKTKASASDKEHKDIDTIDLSVSNHVTNKFLFVIT